jgi:hypothetical protein
MAVGCTAFYSCPDMHLPLPLTDARPRKTEALDRNYLAGAYGGVPRLTVGEIAETLARPLTEPATEVRA